LRILVTFALEQEFAPWHQLGGFVRESRTDFSQYGARMGEARITVVLTGMGPVHAARVAESVLAEGADVCIVAGFAGALRASYRPGQILVPRAVREQSKGAAVKCDGPLLRRAESAGARAVGELVSTDHVVSTAAEKARLGLIADAVDMESFAILNKAAALRIPALAVRAVSDPAETDLPLDFGALTGPDGSVSVARLVGRLAAAPHKLPSVLRLRRESRRAAMALAEFLDSFVRSLVESTVEDARKEAMLIA
jgi:adenosylhomocysteine nucleosidase